MPKTLLLNHNYEVIAFIGHKKSLRLLSKDKVEVLSEWKHIEFNTVDRKVFLPATIRMKYYVRLNYVFIAFSRKAVLKRDKHVCQYCGKKIQPSKATIDHVLPKSMGGQSSFINCVAACFPCNRSKRDRTPEQAEMKLLSRPSVPSRYFYYLHEDEDRHPDWEHYIKDGA